MQYVPPDGSFHVDILTRLGEVHSFDGLASQRLDFDGLSPSSGSATSTKIANSMAATSPMVVPDTALS